MNNAANSCFTRIKSTACRSECEEKCRTWPEILLHAPKRMGYRSIARKDLHGPGVDRADDREGKAFG